MYECLSMEYRNQSNHRITVLSSQNFHKSVEFSLSFSFGRSFELRETHSASRFLELPSVGSGKPPPAFAAVVCPPGGGSGACDASTSSSCAQSSITYMCIVTRSSITISLTQMQYTNTGSGVLHRTTTRLVESICNR